MNVRCFSSRRGFTLEECFPPDHIREYAERSLASLGLPQIDLLQFHVWEDAWAHDERWQRAMDLPVPGEQTRLESWQPGHESLALRRAQDHKATQKTDRHECF